MNAPKQTRVGGAKVTIDPPVSEQIAQAATQSAEVTDETGRVISLKRPGVLAQFQLVEALGDLAQNRTYVAMVAPMLFVSAIDGEPVAKPGTKAEIEALIKRLDEPGVLAVSRGVAERFQLDIDEDAAKNA